MDFKLLSKGAFLLIALHLAASCTEDGRDMLYEPSLYPGEFLSESSFELSATSSGKALSLSLNMASGDTHPNWTISLIDKKEADAYRNYLSQRIGHLHSYLEKNHISGAPQLYDCGIRAPISVYSDIELFGRLPGEDLSDLCRVVKVPVFNRIICSYPDLNVISVVSEDNLSSGGIGLMDFFVLGSALPQPKGIELSFTPSSEDFPDSFSIFVDISVSCSYWYNNDWGVNVVSRQQPVQVFPEERVITCSAFVHN